MSGPRPIHSLPREINTEPSSSEPSLSYEEKHLFLNDDFMSMSAAERFHSKRGDHYSYTPHSSQAAAGGKASLTPRGASFSGSGLPLAAHHASPQSKTRRVKKPQNVRLPEPPLIKEEQQKFKASQSFNGEDSSGLQESLPRSPNSYPSLVGPLQGKKRGESAASTISSVTEDFGPCHSHVEPNSNVLRFPQTPVFTWNSNGDASQTNVVDTLSPISDAATVPRQYARKDSSTSLGRKESKKEAKKRASARMYKHGAMEGSLEFGHDSEIHSLDDSSLFTALTSLGEVSEGSFSNLQGKRLDAVMEKLSAVANHPGKKKLILKDMNLTSREIPTDVICSLPLGPELSKLGLAGNQLNYLPHRLTLDLTGMRTLDIQQCKLASLPADWDLPNLRRLDLGHNRLKSCLPQGALEGLPRLQHLDMNNNEICEWTIPDGDFLMELQHLNLDFNEIVELPANLTKLESLRHLKVSNNLISHVPEQVCKMRLDDLVVIPNPLIQPPSEDCEQGIDGMRRYYIGLAKESAARRRRARRKEKRLLKKDHKLAGKSPDDQEDGAGALSRSALAQKSKSGNKAQVSAFESSSDQVDFSPLSETSPAIEEHQELSHTLKAIFVGMGSTGKTTIIKRLKEGPDAEIPRQEERTIGVDITEWNPMEDIAADSNGTNYDTRVVQEDNCEGGSTAHIQFSVWDFAGQDVYHATHEIFFSPSALYVLVWDMAAKNADVLRRPKVADIDDGWEDSSDEGYEEIYTQRELLRADRALEKDIDDNVQYWVDCIQSRVPGASILPVATFDDLFDGSENGGREEARRRVSKMRERLLHHERRRVKGLEERLQTLKSTHRANSQEASRIMELLSPFRRPKLIFGDMGDPDNVIRVSGKDSRGFDGLRARIINLATGRELVDGMKYPLFRGHIGCPIPGIRVKIREFIRQKKAEKRFQVVELGYFLSMLSEFLGYSVDRGQIGDALRFLSRIGELSFFGDVQSSQSLKRTRREDAHDDSSDDEGTVSTQLYRNRGEKACSISLDDFPGLSRFLFFDPKWLAATLGCILRHDLKQQIEETRYDIDRDIRPSSRWESVGRGDHFHDANVNCPVITASEACMLWKTRKKIRKAAERSVYTECDDNASEACPLVFMQGLLVYFCVFVPIDLNIDKAFLGGRDFSNENLALGADSQRFYFLPSQLSPWDPSDNISDKWTYKSNDSWKTCLCHSWLFPDGSPPGLFEHVTASVLRDLYAVTCVDDAKKFLLTVPDTDGQIGKLYFREILCWKTAFNIILGRTYVAEDGDLRESRVEVWVHLVDQDSHFCVAGESTAVGTRRLVAGGKGPEGNGCRKIWDGGYDLVLKAIERVIGEYGGLECAKQGVCPQCLATRDLRRAKLWDWTCVQDSVKRGPGTITCDNGHRVDIRCVGGQVRLPRTLSTDPEQPDASSRVPFSALCDSVVLVGLWDGEQNRIVMAGSGFVVDSKRGLIVTASHILIDMANGNSFGADYYGLKLGRAVVGVIAGSSKPQRRTTGPQAYFRYFAEIVAKNPRNMDACILRINAKISVDVGGDGSDCGRRGSYPLLQRDDIEKENLPKLRPTKRCEYEEEVRILGYNQGGEGLMHSPRLNRVIEVIKGSIVKIHDARELYHKSQADRNSFRPLTEIVVSCPTIGGQSGGPCVNQAGKVIGILSRADPEDQSRCYLVPAKEFMELVNIARSWDDYQTSSAG